MVERGVAHDVTGKHLAVQRNVRLVSRLERWAKRQSDQDEIRMNVDKEGKEVMTIQARRSNEQEMAKEELYRYTHYIRVAVLWWLDARSNQKFHRGIIEMSHQFSE